jgi:hypothetical protein
LEREDSLGLGSHGKASLHSLVRSVAPCRLGPAGGPARRNPPVFLDFSSSSETGYPRNRLSRSLSLYRDRYQPASCMDVVESLWNEEYVVLLPMPSFGRVSVDSLDPWILPRVDVARFVSSAPPSEDWCAPKPILDSRLLPSSTSERWIAVGGLGAQPPPLSTQLWTCHSRCYVCVVCEFRAILCSMLLPRT